MKSCENPVSPGRPFQAGFSLKISDCVSQKKATPSQQLEQSWLLFARASVVPKRVSRKLAGDPLTFCIWMDIEIWAISNSLARFHHLFLSRHLSWLQMETIRDLICELTASLTGACFRWTAFQLQPDTAYQADIGSAHLLSLVQANSCHDHKIPARSAVGGKRRVCQD